MWGGGVGVWAQGWLTSMGCYTLRQDCPSLGFKSLRVGVAMEVASVMVMEVGCHP